MRKRYSLTLNEDQLELVEDALSYYRLCDWGGGDHADDHEALSRILDRVTDARQRLYE